MFVAAPRKNKTNDAWACDWCRGDVGVTKNSQSQEAGAARA